MVLYGVGLGHAMVWIILLTVCEEDPILLTNRAWEDLEFVVALESGLVVQVCAPADCPGHALQESPGSRCSQELLMGDGGTVSNLGQPQQRRAFDLSDRRRYEAADVDGEDMRRGPQDHL